MLKWPNLTGVSGATYNADATENVSFSGATALPGASTITDTATADGWVDGDEVGILVWKDATNYQVWTATWNATSSTLDLAVVEEDVGTLTDLDSVTVKCVVTEKMLEAGFARPEKGTFIVVSGTTYTAGNSAAGRTICCTSSSATTITLDSDASVGVQFQIVQEGAGAVSIARSGSDTVNGSTSVSVSAQYKSAYVYQRTEAAWIAVV